MLELLDASAAAPDYIIGLFSVELGQCSSDQGLLEDTNQYFDRADEDFQRSQHNYGLKEVRLLRLLLSKVDHQKKASEICSVLQHYYSLDYQLGMQRVAQRLQRLSFARRDMVTSYNVQRLSEVICTNTGQRLTQAISDVGLLASMAVLTGSFGKVVEFGESFFRQCQAGLLFLAHQAAGTLSRAFASMKRLEEAVSWAQ